ncbi:5455_t:CDS:2, partial [Dentiscutata erythropus]
MSGLPVVAYSKQLEKYLNEYNIRNFCHSEFSDHKIIGQGGFAVVYSVVFQGTKYALKSLNNNIVLDNKAFKQIKNEIKCLYRDKINHPNVIKLYGFSIDYANLYKNCWSSDPDQRPVLNEILTKLERLSNLSIKFMINNIDAEDQYLSKDSVFYDDTNSSLKSNNDIEVIDNRQMFPKTRPLGTSKQPSQSRENRKRRQEVRNREPISRSPNPNMASMYSEDVQPNLTLQIPIYSPNHTGNSLNNGQENLPNGSHIEISSKSEQGITSGGNLVNGDLDGNHSELTLFPQENPS